MKDLSVIEKFLLVLLLRDQMNRALILAAISASTYAAHAMTDVDLIIPLTNATEDQLRYRYPNAADQLRLAAENAQRTVEVEIDLYPTVIALLKILKDETKAAEHENALEQIKKIYAQQIAVFTAIVALAANNPHDVRFIKAKASLRLAQMFMGMRNYNDFQPGIRALSKEFGPKVAFNLPNIGCE